MTARRARRWALAAGLVCAARGASADTPRDTPAAVEVDRDAAPAGRVGFGFDGGQPVDAWGASLAVSWLERPIRLADGALGEGSAASDPVRRRQTVAIGGALAIHDAIVLDAQLRGSHQVGDRLRAAGDPAPLAARVLHDLRLGGRIRIAGSRARAALLRAELTLPTGNAGQLAGEPRWTAAWSLIGRTTLPRGAVLAATVGIRLRGAEVVIGDRVIGDELFAAAGVAVPVAPGWDVTGEVLGALGDRVAGRVGPSPVEVRLGGLAEPTPGIRIGAYVGAGLGEQIGAPLVRVGITVAWTPERPRAPVDAARRPEEDERGGEDEAGDGGADEASDDGDSDDAAPAR